MPLSDDIAQIREDVSYIKAKIEIIPDHESRLRVLERFRYAVPGTAVLGLVVSSIVAGFALFT